MDVAAIRRIAIVGPVLWDRTSQDVATHVYGCEVAMHARAEERLRHARGAITAREEEPPGPVPPALVDHDAIGWPGRGMLEATHDALLPSIPHRMEDHDAHTHLAHTRCDAR